MVVFAKTIDQKAISQILRTANSPLGENAHIRIMPDAHAGAGCTVGTTMLITNKICPNLVGVDIGCGVDFAETSLDFSGGMLEKLDKIIRQAVPSGMKLHKKQQMGEDFFGKLYCWNSLKQEAKANALHALGTLGGGNHFIEAYEGGHIAVHSGSRNLGLQVARFYQSLAEKRFNQDQSRILKSRLSELPEQEREAYLKVNKVTKRPLDLAYLEGDDMEKYLWDALIATRFAELNRKAIITRITSLLGGKIKSHIVSTHNYIDSDKILRKGAISAGAGERLVIPLNMRDGLLECEGVGNEDWNHSAPHGAGRLYSRSKAKQVISLEEYTGAMEGIYTTSVNYSTLDEAPFAYKDYKEIMETVSPTVNIVKRWKPVYNFKAN
ncbi:MAG: RtcB family protein [Eubacteriaceae bacterium]|nr:RtcB family protein [Eubacteriaceae bacterium]